jgi:hypothetical protein
MAENERPPGRRVLRCTEVRGKNVDDVFVRGDGDFNAVTINFTDRTSLTVQVLPAARLRAELNDWSSGDARPIKLWPTIITL